MTSAPSLIPSVTFHVMQNGRPVPVSSVEVFRRKSVALFGLPGAFMPASHFVHLPSIITEYADFKASGSDLVACTSTNDVYVMSAWAEMLGASDNILFLSDGNGDFARALGLLFDGRALGLGFRTRRYAMWVKNGVIQHLTVEPDPTQADVSTAYALLGMFDRWSATSLANST